MDDEEYQSELRERTLRNMRWGMRCGIGTLVFLTGVIVFALAIANYWLAGAAITGLTTVATTVLVAMLQSGKD